ncbi:MAG: glycosyltransferase family 1 protein [Ekhidna sp.]|nr:glycosyltransferase family 1 protein [Ekhidna sp.]
MKKVKIAFFIDILKENTDGVTNTSYRIISRLDELGIEALFFTCVPPSSRNFKYKVVICPHLKFPYAKDYPFAIPGKRQKIFKILDEFNPDLLHWSSPSLLGKYATEYSIRNGVPNITIYHSHFSSYIDYLKWLPFRSEIRNFLDKKLTRLYEKASLILAPTLSMKEFLVERGTDPDKIGIWGRGVDGKKFNPHHRSEALIDRWGGRKKTKILFVSRLVHYKETDMLIRLSHILRPNTLLLITGEGPERSKMEKESDPEKTIFTGKLIGKQLSEVYASADMFVFPSLTDTFGNVVLEAMASGLPVLAANEGGPKNIVQDGKTGYLLEPKNEKAFNEKIDLLIDNKSHYREMRENALNYAQNVSWDNIIKQIHRFYIDLIGK